MIVNIRKNSTQIIQGTCVGCTGKRQGKMGIYLGLSLKRLDLRSAEDGSGTVGFAYTRALVVSFAVTQIPAVSTLRHFFIS